MGIEGGVVKGEWIPILVTYTHTHTFRNKYR